MLRTKRFLAIGVAAGLLAGALAGTAGAGQNRKSAPLKGEGEGLKLIKNIPWKSGTDMEFTTIKGHEVGFAMSRGPLAEGGGSSDPERGQTGQPEDHESRPLRSESG